MTSSSLLFVTVSLSSSGPTFVTGASAKMPGRQHANVCQLVHLLQLQPWLLPGCVATKTFGIPIFAELLSVGCTHIVSNKAPSLAILGDSMETADAAFGGTQVPEALFQPICQVPSSSDWHEGIPRFFAEAVHGIPRCYISVLRYISHFKHVASYNFRCAINGGFVRDLLTGKQSDDLDVTWDLRPCREGLCIADILADLVEFSTKTKLFGVTEVSLVEILGDAEKGKTVDVVKASFHFNDAESTTITVDVMPALDAQGNPSRTTTLRDDAFRRDLTINALLLEVDLSSAPRSSLLNDLLDNRKRNDHREPKELDRAEADVLGEFPFTNGSVVCHGLRFSLLDYVGGVVDLLVKKALRPPAMVHAHEGDPLSLVLRRFSTVAVASEGDQRNCRAELLHHVKRRFPSCVQQGANELFLTTAAATYVNAARSPMPRTPNT